MINFFSAREIAILFWLSILVIYSLTKKNFGKSFVELIRVFFQHKIIVPILLLIIYVELQILGLVKIGVWETSLLKDTIYWPMFVGFPMLLKSSKIRSEKKYFKSVFKDSIKGIVILEFIANFYSFPLLMELIIIPIMTIVVVSQIYTKDKPEYKAVEKIFRFLTSIFGLTVLIYSTYKIYQGFGEVVNLSTLKSFLLPIFLTITFIPFIYFVALWSLYETMLLRIGHRLKRKKDKRYLKWKIFTKFGFNRKKLRRFQRDLGFDQIMDRKDVRQMFRKSQE